VDLKISETSSYFDFFCQYRKYIGILEDVLSSPIKVSKIGGDSGLLGVQSVIQYSLFQIFAEEKNATIAKHPNFYHFLCLTGARSNKVSMGVEPLFNGWDPDEFFKGVF
jgi:hypothetical protein